jgi:hypothetical protein
MVAHRFGTDADGALTRGPPREYFPLRLLRITGLVC